MSIDVRAFEEFCRGKPAGEEYPYYDGSRCALAQFGYRAVTYGKLAKTGVTSAVYAAALDFPHTFGALADRLSRIEG